MQNKDDKIGRSNMSSIPSGFEELYENPRVVGELEFEPAWFDDAAREPVKVICSKVMRRDHSVLAPDDTLAEAALAMVRDNSTAVPVVFDGRFVGLVTERCLVALGLVDPDNVGEMSVDQVMLYGADVPKLAPGESVGGMFALIRENGLFNLPVVEGGVLLGMLHMADLVRLAKREPPLLELIVEFCAEPDVWEGV